MREPTRFAHPSGELFELEAQLAQAVVAFRERQPLVSGEEARKRVIVCVEAERSRTVPFGQSSRALRHDAARAPGAGAGTPNIFKQSWHF